MVSNSTQKFVTLYMVTIILKNFAFGICGAKGDWSMVNFVDMQIAQIRETVATVALLDPQVGLTHSLLVSFAKLSVIN